jgi:D-alanine-D-alanine ligase
MSIDVYRKGITERFMEEVNSLTQENTDFVYNLVESINNKGELNYFVPALLNMYGIPYTGNSHEAIFLTTSKTIASKTMKQAGIPNPGCYFPSQMNLLLPGSRYILKPIWEDGSLGITSDSVFVWNPEFQEKLTGLSDSHWFIEDFIEGREFNMSVLAGNEGPEVLPVAEIVFVDYDDSRPRIIDFKAKWEMGTFEYTNTVRDFPGDKIDSEVMRKLRQAAIDCWNLFGLKGYARVDARVDSNNNIFVIEINANPCISPDGGFMSATRAGGYKFPEVLQRIIDDLNK